MSAENVKPSSLALRQFLKRFFSKPAAVTALAWVIVVTLASVFATRMAAHDPLEQDLTGARQMPNAEHWLGTDTLGRDLFSRLLHGGQITLAGVAIALVIGLILGIITGILSGYIGGKGDTFLSGVIDIALAVPLIVVLLSVLSVFDQSMLMAMAAIGILGAAFIARVVRSASQAIRNDLYIQAAKVHGRSEMGIMRGHVLPRTLAPAVVQVSIFACTALVIQSGINFLGLGFQPPAPTWGGMIADAAGSIADFPWLMVPPSAVIASLVLAFGALGDGISDAMTETWRGVDSRPQAREVTAKETVEPVHHAADRQGQTVLKLDGLVVETRGGQEIVSDVSFELRAGEVLGLVGESGSGKSTVVMSCLGLLPEGLQLRAGQLQTPHAMIDLTEPRPTSHLWGRTLSYIAQDASNSFDPCQTIGSAMSEVLSYAGVPRKERAARIIDLLTAVQLHEPEQVIKKYPHQISGGMAQRIAIARAVATGSHIIIADEPTTALDVTVQWEILTLLHELKDQLGLTILIVSHDWGVVADLCDRTAVMTKGHLVEMGTTEQVMYESSHPYTRKLLSHLPMLQTPGTEASELLVTGPRHDEPAAYQKVGGSSE